MNELENQQQILFNLIRGAGKAYRQLSEANKTGENARQTIYQAGKMFYDCGKGFCDVGAVIRELCAPSSETATGDQSLRDRIKVESDDFDTDEQTTNFLNALLPPIETDGGSTGAGVLQPQQALNETSAHQTFNKPSALEVARRHQRFDEPPAFQIPTRHQTFNEPSAFRTPKINNGLIQPRQVNTFAMNGGAGNHPRRLVVSFRKLYRCSECDYQSTYSNNIKTHMMFKHTGERPFGCQLCPHRTVTRQNMKVHMLTHCPEGINTVHVPNPRPNLI